MNETLTKQALAEHLNERFDKLTQADARAVVDEITETIIRAVQNGDTVQIKGFAKFSRRPTAARTGRNPMTGEAVEIPAGYKVAFKPYFTGAR